MSSRAHQAGGNLTLASALAILSYIPFEYVAKATLLICVLLFVFDPFPPASRLVSLLATVVVAFLSRTNRIWKEQQQREDFTLEQQDSKEKNS